MGYYSMQEANKVRQEMKFKESKDALPYVVNKGKRTKKGKRK